MSEIIMDKDYILAIVSEDGKRSVARHTPESTACSADRIKIQEERLND